MSVRERTGLLRPPVRSRSSLLRVPRSDAKHEFLSPDWIAAVTGDPRRVRGPASRVVLRAPGEPRRHRRAVRRRRGAGFGRLRARARDRAGRARRARPHRAARLRHREGAVRRAGPAGDHAGVLRRQDPHHRGCDEAAHLADAQTGRHQPRARPAARDQRPGEGRDARSRQLGACTSCTVVPGRRFSPASGLVAKTGRPAAAVPSTGIEARLAQLL